MLAVMVAVVIVVSVGSTHSHTLDADMDPISALIGGGLSLISGLFGSSSQQTINQQQIQAQQQANAANLKFSTDQAEGTYMPQYIQNLVSGAKSSGLNPLSVLGVSNQASSPMQVGTSGLEAPGASMASGISNAGKIMSEMQLPGASAPSKLDELKAQLVQSQIDQTNAETTGIMLRNSHLAVATQPGVRPGSTEGSAVPAFTWFTDDKGRPFLGQSKEFAETQFGPGAWVPGTIAGFKTLGENVVQGAKSVGDDLSSVWSSVVRPDVQRVIEGAQVGY